MFLVKGRMAFEPSQAGMSPWGLFTYSSSSKFLPCKMMLFSENHSWERAKNEDSPLDTRTFPSAWITLYSFSYCCDQIPNKKQFKGERVDCGSLCQETFVCGEEGMTIRQEHEGAGHSVSVVRKQGDEFWGCAFSF